VKDNPSELKIDASNVHVTDSLPPLEAIRKHCLWCCNGSAHEVNLCAAKACPLWMYRYGKKPTADMLEEAGDALMYPVEDGTTVADFFEKGGTRLKAIKRRCLDCSGGSKADVRDCQHVACDLHPFRFGRNPNRTMSREQRELAAARLKANVEGAKATASVDGQNSPTHAGKQRAQATRGLLRTGLGRARKSRRETELVDKK
jgi:hypothetical protein